MANANLFQQYLQPARSVLDYQNDYEKADALKNQNAIQSLALQQNQAATAQSLAERNALQRIAAGWSADTTPEQRSAALRNSGLPGLMTQADTFDQTRAKLMESQATAAEKNAAAAKTTQGTSIEAHQQRLQRLSMVNSPEELMQWAIDDAQNDPSQRSRLGGALSAIQTAAQDPTGAAFQKLKASIQQSGLVMQQQMEMTAAKPTEVRLGNVVKMFDTNPHSPTFGKEVVQPQAIGVSPDAAATTGLGYARLTEDKRHNSATEANSNGQVTYQTDAAGNMVAVPTRVAPGTTVQGQAVVDSTGKVIPGKSNLTETQGKATTFAARMADAESVIKAMESKGVSGSDLRTIAAGNGYTNALASPEGQQYRQAQENWVTANLRQESGAAIGKDEMDKDVRKFFPAPGDSPEVKTQKARARAVAQQGMMMQAGPGANQVPKILSSANASPAPAAGGWKVEEVK